MKPLASVSSCAFVAVLIAAATPLQAIPVSIGIDFRDAAWAGASGSKQFTVGDVTVEAYRPSLFFGDIGLIAQDSTDGLGVNHAFDLSPDEIAGYEYLAVTLGGSSGQGLGGIWLSDLFDESTTHLPDAELGFYRIDGGGWNSFTGLDSDSGGFQYIDFGGPIDAAQIDFTARISLIDDYSLVGFEYAGDLSEPRDGVPESGSSLILLGMGLFGVGLAQRSFRRGRARVSSETAQAPGF